MGAPAPQRAADHAFATRYHLAVALLFSNVLDGREDIPRENVRRGAERIHLTDEWAWR